MLVFSVPTSKIKGKKSTESLSNNTNLLCLAIKVRSRDLVELQYTTLIEQSSQIEFVSTIFP